MAPLRFRAWDEKSRKMYVGGNAAEVLLVNVGDAEHDELKVSFGADLHDDYEVCREDNGHGPWHIMQFTGLLDGDDREIYEGDILEIEGQRATVVWWERPPEFGLQEHDEELWCPDWNITDDSDRMKVVGNIYENPDLLPKSV